MKLYICNTGWALGEVKCYDYSSREGKVSAYNFVAGSMDLELKHHNYTELQED